MSRVADMFKTLVCLLLAMASMSHDQRKNSEENMRCHSKVSSSFYKTKEGNQIPRSQVHYEIKSEHLPVKYHFDIASVLQLRVPNDTLSYLEIEMECSSPIQLCFTNLHTLINKNILSKLTFAGPCIVSVQNLVVWSNATDFLSVEIGTDINGQSPKLVNEKGTLKSGIQTLVAIAFYKSTPRGILDMLSIAENVWPRMAEITLSNLSLETTPAELRMAMPLLQTLYLQSNKLTQPPYFPWSNSSLELPRGLRRSRVFNDEIKSREGIDIDANIYCRILKLDSNNIEDLASYEFKGFLHKLSLARNGLQKVGAACFRDLSGIQVIDLSSNKLEDLPSQLFHGLSSLLEIQLGDNNLSVVPPEIFKGLKNIKKITLNHNNIRSIPSGLFNRLDALEVVNLEGNKIAKLDEGVFSNDSIVREIYLRNNNLTHIPTVIFRLRNASNIDLSHNLLTFQDLLVVVDSLSEESFKANFSSKDTGSKLLNLSNNNFTTLDIQGLSGVKQWKIIRFLEMYEIDLTENRLICDCGILGIKQKIETLLKSNRAWKSKFKTWKCAWPEELRDQNILKINENQIIAQRKPKFCPVECSCFERCLDYTILMDCEGRNITEVPRMLSRGALIELNLRNNNIREIQVYPYMKNLLALYLTHNKIQQLNPMMVNSLKQIRILHVDSNNLTSLPRNIESLHLKNLALHDNVFKCSCNIKWMKNWLQRLNHRQQVEQIENVLCESDNTEQVKAIYTLPDENFGCNGTAGHDKNVGTKTTIIQERTSTIIAASLGSLLAMNVMIFILLHKYRRTVKAFMYTHFNWHPFDRIDDLDSTKIYDAFVSYSEKERQWVVNTLQQRLENHHPPYKLCIHHRDFEVGAPIVTNILNSVEQSKRMLMVLSHNFLQSEWCMLEFRTAHHKALEDRLKLIIILFDELNFAELDNEIKLYMRTNTYLRVSDSWFWEKLIHAMPQRSIRND